MTESSSNSLVTINWPEQLISKTNVSRERIKEFCERRGIVALYVFGSVLRDDFGPCSDIDLLFQKIPDGSNCMHELYSMERELENMFGRKVDFVNRKEIESSNNHLRRNLIFRTMEAVYDGRQWLSVMTEIDRILILDVVNIATEAHCSVKNVDYETFRRSREKYQSVALDILMISDKFCKVSDLCKSHFPVVSWTDVIGMRRNIVIDHGKVNIAMLWRVAMYQLPRLTESLSELLREDL